MPVDQINRDRLAAAMRRFLAGEITAFTLEDERWEVDTKNDPTLHYVSELVWCFYDDCKDHQVNLTKDAWDLWQRLLLLLQSDATIQTVRRRIWDWSQFVAGIGVLVFSITAAWLGWRFELFVIWILLGVVAMLLARRRERLVPEPSVLERALYPYASMGQLMRIRRMYPDFVKVKYPCGVEKQPLRSPGELLRLRLQWSFVELIFSPLVLLSQIFPVTSQRSSVVVR